MALKEESVDCDPAVSTEPLFRLEDISKELKNTLAELKLFSFQIDRWLIVQRDSFDLVLHGEPYQALQILLNVADGHFSLRAFGKNKDRGTVANLAELQQLFWDSFYETVACAGYVDALPETAGVDCPDYVVAEFPFRRKISRECEMVYQLNEHQSELEALGMGICDACLRVKKEPGTDAMNFLDGGPEIKVEKEEEEADLGEDLASCEDPLSDGRPVTRRGRKRRAKPCSDDENDEDFTLGAKISTEKKPKRTYKKKAKENVSDGDQSETKREPTKRKNRKRQAHKLGKKIVDGKVKFICDQCDKLGCSITSMLRHKRRVHLHGEFPCQAESCTFFCEYPQHLVDHLNKQHEDTMLVICSICQVEIKFRDEDFVQHFTQCVKAETLAQSRLQVAKEKAKGKPKKYFQCEVCGALLNSQGHMREHMHKHEGVKPFKCDECDYSAIYKSSIYLHKKRHMREKGLSEDEVGMRLYHPCEFCGRVMSSACELKSHINGVHLKIKENKQCKVCREIFDTRSQYLRHYNQEHSADPRYQCKECGKRFGDLQLTKRHMLSHGDPKFECQYCGKALKKKENLEAHERMHTGERPYSCKYCVYSCMSSDTLRQHRKFKHKEIWMKLKAEREREDQKEEEGAKAQSSREEAISG